MFISGKRLAAIGTENHVGEPVQRKLPSRARIKVSTKNFGMAGLGGNWSYSGNYLVVIDISAEIVPKTWKWRMIMLRTQLPEQVNCGTVNHGVRNRPRWAR